MSPTQLTIAFALLLPLAARAADQPLIVPLLPNTQPAASDPSEKIQDLTPGRVDRFITNVRTPMLFVYLPPKDKATGAAVVICPGGAYAGVAIDREGHDVARWLNSIGVAGVILKYRMPRPDLSTNEKPYPVQDAARTMRLVRGRAAEWNIDPRRVGIMGFSAGGHLASTIATHFDAGSPAAADPLDRLASRPDFAILVYPVITFRDPVGHTGSRDNLIGKNAPEALVAEYCNDEKVTSQTPPTFLVHARDDGVKIANSERFAEALKKANVPCRIEIYATGGHGYGIGMNGGEVATWPSRCADWLRSQDLLSPAKP